MKFPRDIEGLQPSFTDWKRGGLFKASNQTVWILPLASKWKSEKHQNGQLLGISAHLTLFFRSGPFFSTKKSTNKKGLPTFWHVKIQVRPWTWNVWSFGWFKRRSQVPAHKDEAMVNISSKFLGKFWTCWWLVPQPILKHMLVKLDHETPQIGLENKKCFETTTYLKDGLPVSNMVNNHSW